MAGIHRSPSGHAKPGLPPQELLDDLCSRFVLNVPKEDLESFERILFLVEQAHWFYEDNSVEQNPSLKSLTLREFTNLMFHSCAALRPYIDHIDDIYKDFTTYKFRVPVTGAIILDDSYERCLLVKGWKAGASWSFPRGKKNKDEEDHTCAIREVLEETGCNVAEHLKIDDFIEVVLGQQRVRLFIVTGVKEDTSFAPQTKKEISEISWHPISDLQPAGDDVVSRGASLKLYMVAPFLMSLKTWISKHQPNTSRKSEAFTKGVTCVWKAKNNTSGSAPSAETTPTKSIPVSGGMSHAENTPTKFVPVSGGMPHVEKTPTKHVAELDSRPGRSFRNFRFNTPRILQSMEAAFSVK